MAFPLDRSQAGWLYSRRTFSPSKVKRFVDSSVMSSLGSGGFGRGRPDGFLFKPARAITSVNLNSISRVRVASSRARAAWTAGEGNSMVWALTHGRASSPQARAAKADVSARMAGTLGAADLRGARTAGGDGPRA